MRPTRRGYGAVAVVALAVGMAWLAGPRALNALAAPVVVAVLAAAVQLRLSGSPAIERTDPRPGFPGETRTVELRVEGRGVARVEDRLSGGLAGDAAGGGTLPTSVTYDVALEERGERTLGPATVRVRDALGLLETTREVGDATPLLVYPRVSVVDGAGFFAETLGPESDDRTEFDRLREYVPGDRLRDVHWKSTAKHGDLLVTTYTDPVDDESVRIVAAAEEGHADAMAEATASIVAGALRLGLAVELAVPDGTVGRGFGTTHRRRALELLARTGAGDPAGGTEADVFVSATDDGVAVTSAAGTLGMDELTVRRENPLRARGGVA